MSSIFRWILQVILFVLFCFLLVFGIILLISAYQLKDPFSFIMTFFASNLIILMSGALLVGLVLRMLASHRNSEHTTPTRPTPLSKAPTSSDMEGGGPVVGSAEHQGGGEK